MLSKILQPFPCPQVLHEDDPSCEALEEAASGHTIDPKVVEATSDILGESDTKNKGTPPAEGLGPFAPHPKRETLFGALHGHDTFNGAQDDLWRLLCHLRMGPAGSEADIIKNPLLTRKLVLSQPKRWHDLVRHQICQANAMDNLPAMRKSRVSAWVELTEKARKTAAPNLPSSLTICSGDVVAVRWQGSWKVSLVLTTWRILKKGAGAQQCFGKAAKGGLHSARVLILEQQEGEPGLYHGGVRNECVVLSVDHIGMRLDNENTHRKQFIDGVKVLLGKDIGKGPMHFSIVFWHCGV